MDLDGVTGELGLGYMTSAVTLNRLLVTKMSAAKKGLVNINTRKEGQAVQLK